MVSARNVLQEFINEMFNYEVEWGKLLEENVEETLSEKSNNLRLIKVIEIQNKFLSKKALSLKQDRQTTLTFELPPEYGQQIVHEKIINNRKIEFDTIRDGDPYRKFTMVLEDSLWKVDKMAISSLNWRVSRQVF